MERQLIDQLLALSDKKQQSSFLQENGLLDEEGLSQILNTATELARRDPGQARLLAAACADAARCAPVHTVIPRANYIQAQTFALKGDFGRSLDLIADAYQGYMDLNMPLEALRTNVGKMHILTQQADHQTVLQVGDQTLELLAQFQSREAQQIQAFVFHNRGVCLRRMGRYEEALVAYAAAEEQYLAIDMNERLGDIYNNRGVTLLSLGRVTEALIAFEAAAEAYSGSGLTLLHGQALINIGDAHLLLGNFTRSLDMLAQAHRLLESLDALAEEHILLLDRADVYMALNLYPEALEVYRQADEQFATAGMSHYHGRALWGLGAALMASGRLDEAGQALNRAAELFQSTETTPLLVSVLLEQAALEAAQNRLEQARLTARRAYELTAEGRWPVQRLYAHLRLADLLADDFTAAEHHLQAAQELAQQLVLPHLRYRLLQRHGTLRRRQGRPQEARRLLESAVDEIERLRGTVAQEAMRVSFLYDKVSVYQELLQLHLEEENVEQAFVVAEQAKSRTLLDLITGVIGPKSQAADSEVAGRLLQLQGDLNAAYNEFLSAKPEGAGQNRRDLEQRVTLLEKEIRRLQLQVDGGRGSDPFAQPFDSRLALDDGLTLLAYHMAGDEILAFVHRQGELQLSRHLASGREVQALLQQLNAQWSRFQAGPDFVNRHMPALIRSTQRILQQLHTLLIAPVLDQLPQTEKPGRLAIIPHDLLHQVPFHALFDGQRYLIDDFEISYAPSAAVLQVCQQKPELEMVKAAVFGVSDPLIPAAIQEAETIGSMLPGSQTYLEDKATLANMQTAAGSCQLLHMATHGLFRADNPIFSALKLHDGWLTAADISTARLPNSLVTLSACESGRSQVTAGDELLGLTRAFLGAGASTLVVSLWLVQDETTAELMAGWYRRLQEQDFKRRASALRQAQLALRDRFEHPYYWAPFILVGQR